VFGEWRKGSVFNGLMAADRGLMAFGLTAKAVEYLKDGQNV